MWENAECELNDLKKARFWHHASCFVNIEAGSVCYVLPRTQFVSHSCAPLPRQLDRIISFLIQAHIDVLRPTWFYV